MNFRLTAVVLVAVSMLDPATAFAWGGQGHRLIGQVAVRALPAEAPAFLRTAQAADDIGEWSREPDRSRDAGRVHDHDRDAGHFIDLDDQGQVMGGPPLAALPPTKASYETALRSVGVDMWEAGYLPYSIVDAFQQLRKDFAYWRVLSAAEANPNWRGNRAWFASDRRRREAAILQNLGRMAHFVGDGSQPLHVSIHHNGWGEYPNPKGYSTAKLHGRFEGDFVRDNVGVKDVRARMPPLRSCNCPVEVRTAQYLEQSRQLVETFYEMEKAGGLADGDLRGIEFAAGRLAVGAAELRDLVVEAWRASAAERVGWKPVSVADVTAGKVDPFPSLRGVD